MDRLWSKPKTQEPKTRNQGIAAGEGESSVFLVLCEVGQRKEKKYITKSPWEKQEPLRGSNEHQLLTIFIPSNQLLAKIVWQGPSFQSQYCHSYWTITAPERWVTIQ